MHIYFTYSLFSSKEIIYLCQEKKKWNTNTMGKQINTLPWESDVGALQQSWQPTFLFKPGSARGGCSGLHPTRVWVSPVHPWQLLPAFAPSIEMTAMWLIHGGIQAPRSDWSAACQKWHGITPPHPVSALLKYYSKPPTVVLGAQLELGAPDVTSVTPSAYKT